MKADDRMEKGAKTIEKTNPKGHRRGETKTHTKKDETGKKKRSLKMNHEMNVATMTAERNGEKTNDGMKRREMNDATMNVAEMNEEMNDKMKFVDNRRVIAQRRNLQMAVSKEKPRDRQKGALIISIDRKRSHLNNSKAHHRPLANVNARRRPTKGRRESPAPSSKPKKAIQNMARRRNTNPKPLRKRRTLWRNC